MITTEDFNIYTPKKRSSLVDSKQPMLFDSGSVKEISKAFEHVCNGPNGKVFIISIALSITVTCCGVAYIISRKQSVSEETINT